MTQDTSNMNISGDNKKINKEKVKKIVTIVLNVLVWIFVAFAVAITVLVFAAQANADGIPAIGGKAMINILTNSMSPEFEAGDIILAEMLTVEDKAACQVGEVITFYADLDGDGNNEINSHRIVKINYDNNNNVVSYTTRGDNKATNQTDDPNPVSWQNVICRYTGQRVKGIGGFIGFLQTSMGFFLLIVLPLILFFLYELYRFIVTFISIKNSGKKQITAADEELIRQRAIADFLRQQEEAKAAEAAAANQTPTAQDAPTSADADIIEDTQTTEASQTSEAEDDASKEQLN